MASQQFSLKWNNHTSNMLSIFENLLTNETFVDVTLACDGLSLKAHKMVLSACSAYFHSLFLENPCKHPIVIMKDVAYKDLKAIIDFMYHGEVNVSQDQLSALLKTAETLKVKGLTEVSGNQERDSGQQTAPPPINVPVPAASSTPQPSLPNISDSTPMRAKRKRVRSRRRSSDSGGSDDEIVPTKIKEPNSPDIEEVIEESSGIDDSIHRRGMTNAPRSSRHSSHTSFSSKRHSSSNAQVHDPTSGEDDVEPSKLLVQTLTTESSIPAGAVSSSNASLPLGTGIEISQVSDNQALVPVSAMSDSMGSSHFQGPDSPQDVKPVITFEDQIPGTSQSAMFLDQSSMPGPSGYEDNSMVSQEGQSQGEGAIGSDSTCEPLLEGLANEDDEFFTELNSAAVDIPEELTDGSPPPDSSHIPNQEADSTKNNPVHTDESPFQCHVCHCAFTQETQLQEHLRIYRGEGSFNCTSCISTFTLLSDFNEHLLIHSDENPFQCDVCRASFKRRVYLRRHIIRVHNVESNF